MASNSPTTALRAGERHIIATLSEAGPASRRQLAERTGLPRTTVTVTVTGLLERGLLTEDEDRTGQRAAGRPAATLRLATTHRTMAAVVLARQSQHLTLCDLDGQAHTSVPLHVERSASVEETADAVLAALAQAGGERAPSVVVVSVAMPYRYGAAAGAGPVLADSAVVHPQFMPPAWLRADPAPLLAARLGMPVLVENDANLAALGEAHHGAARGAHTAVHLSIAEGLGAGIVIGGTLHRGATGMAGELAHVSVDEYGDLCLCGNRGCLSTRHRGGPRDLVSDVAGAHGRPVTLDDIITMAQRGDAIVRRGLTDLGRLLAEPLLGFVSLLNPDAVVVDGALGAAGEPVVTGLREILERRTPPVIGEALGIRRGALGSRAVVLGAATLARQHYLAQLLGPGHPRARARTAQEGIPW